MSRPESRPVRELSAAVGLSAAARTQCGEVGLHGAASEALSLNCRITLTIICSNKRTAPFFKTYFCAPSNKFMFLKDYFYFLRGLKDFIK